ncbi:MAG: class I SAM-dependent methyltransferase [Alphaproteobacteria bacterium]|nr:class I SAM-dependent methyltransferase [Alphaproteobacteria bacterium]
MGTKDLLKKYTPFSSHLLPVYHGIREQFEILLLKLEGRQKTFSRYYTKNKWKDVHSRSGEGSNLEQTKVIRNLLPQIFAEYKVTSIVDFPCGDFFWMKEVDLEGIQYTGCDIVPEMIENNIKEHASENINFLCVDMCEGVPPKADLIFCRDALVHLSFADIKKAVTNLKKSGAKYLLTTTFPDRSENKDIPTGAWRTLNLQIAPFNFCEPIALYNEQYMGQEGRYADKSLALWKLEDLPELK